MELNGLKLLYHYLRNEQQQNTVLFLLVLFKILHHIVVAELYI